MKEKLPAIRCRVSTYAAFFNLRIVIGLFTITAGVFLAVFATADPSRLTSGKLTWKKDIHGNQTIGSPAIQSAALFPAVESQDAPSSPYITLSGVIEPNTKEARSFAVGAPLMTQSPAVNRFTRPGNDPSAAGRKFEATGIAHPQLPAGARASSQTASDSAFPQVKTTEGRGSPTPTPTCTPWRNEPPMANARTFLAAAVVGSNLYAITGYNAGPDFYTDANERFDGTSWTTMAPIPMKHSQARAAVIGDKVYVPGGFNINAGNFTLDTMQIYDTTTDTWSMGMPLPAAHSSSAVAAFNNRVYVIGGYTPSGVILISDNEVYIYDPVSNSYTAGAPMPAPQAAVVGVLFDGEIYVVGGSEIPGAHYAYNPISNTWRTFAPLPTPGYATDIANGFVLDEELWIVGSSNAPIPRQVWIYNRETDTWRAGPEFSEIHQGPGAALFNSRGFVIGGGHQGGNIPSAVVESVAGSCPTPVPTPTPTPGPCSFRVLIVYSDGRPDHLRSQIQAESDVTAVDLFDAFSGTPTVSQLQQCDIVVVYSNTPFQDSVTLGNNLADYVDGGGVVVQQAFAYYDLLELGDPHGINGRWWSGGYNLFHCLNAVCGFLDDPFSLGAHVAEHPLMAGVTALNGDRTNITNLEAGATTVAWMNTNPELVAYRAVSGHHATVGNTQYIGFDAVQSGDWGRMIVNAGRWLRPCGTPTPTPTPTCTPGPLWQVKDPMPYLALAPFVVSDGTFFYVGGGDDVTSQHGDLLRYDPIADTWTNLAPSPDTHSMSQAVVFNGKIYNIAGLRGFSQGGTNTTRIYDIATDTWTTGTPFPGLYLGMATVLLDGKIYVAGGFNGIEATTTLYIYDIANDTWASGPPMPMAVYHPGFGVIDGEIYVASGTNGAVEVSTLQIYNPASNTWRMGPNVPTPMTAPGSAIIKGKLYLFGGSPSFPSASALTQIYDPVSNSWTIGPSMNVARTWVYGATMDDTRILAPGGYNVNAVNVNELFTIGGPCATPTSTPTATPTATARPTPTPRSRPTPRPHPTPPPRP